MPDLMSIRGVVALVLAEVAEDCGGLVKHLAVVDDDRKLTVGELTGRLAGNESGKVDTLVLKDDFCVGQEHLYELHTTVKAEVDDFGV